MVRVFWMMTALGGLVGALVLMVGLLATNGTPQDAAAAATAEL